MKKTVRLRFFTLMILTLISAYCRADSWDNLTRDEAIQVETYLISNPYILDYCDCCDFEGDYAVKVYLMKVKSSKIVPCEWNSEYYSVIAEVEMIAEIPYQQSGPNMNSPVRKKGISSLTLSTNYTWVYSESEKKAVPFYCAIHFTNANEQNTSSGVCGEFVPFPFPVKIDSWEYDKWYREKF